MLTIALCRPSSSREDQVLVIQLNGYASENILVRDPRILHLDPNRQGVVFNAGVNDGLEILELDLRRFLQSGPSLQPFELVVTHRHRTADRSAHAGAVAAHEAVAFFREPHLLGEREASARHVEQGVLFRGIQRHAVLARHRGIYEFNQYVLADTLDPAIAPDLEGVGRGHSAAFLIRSLVHPSGGVRFNLVGRTEGDVDAAAVGPPAGNARCVPLVGVGDPPVVLFPVFVLLRVGSGVSPQPELLDEVLALLVRRQANKSLLFFRGQDVADIFTHPLPEGSAQLVLKLLQAFLLFLLRELPRLLPLGSFNQRGSETESDKNNKPTNNEHSPHSHL